ncbi:MAG: FAD-dependent monooxygenase [Hyphomicrobiaceae bacterium]|nr:FAD-dependent monooxygenase [Hyphomicrobiaceae bacterium]
MTKAREFAVVGAGVGGLAVGTLLARAGHRVTLYERFAEPQPVGSGLMLQPTGLAALARLGLRGAVEALGARIGRLHGLTDTGRTVFDLSYAGLGPDHYAIGIHRAALHGALWQAFRNSGGDIEAGREIVDVERRADGRAAPVDALGRRAAVADLVIDASGARSRLRALVSPRRPRPYTFGAVWASVPDIGIAEQALAQRYVAARIMIGYLPIGRPDAGAERLAALFWSLKPSQYDDWRRDFAAWREKVVGLWPALAPVVSALPGPEAFAQASYVQFTAAPPFAGPLVLIGDAAHATSPQLGQGANSALLDAVVLADALSGHADIGAALRTFAAARRRHVRFYQWAGALMTPFFQSDSRLLPIARDLAFDRAKLLPIVHRQMLWTLAGLKTGLWSHADCTALAGGQPSAQVQASASRGG